MVVAIVVLLLVTLQATATVAHYSDQSNDCLFARDVNQIKCKSDFACTALKPGGSHSDRSVLPSDAYEFYVGQGSSNNSFHLYPIYNESVWDYYNTPGLGCHNQFLLHGGSYKSGSITIENDDCMNRLASHLHTLTLSSVKVKYCRSCKRRPRCLRDRCACGVRTKTKPYLTTLYVLNFSRWTS